MRSPPRHDVAIFAPLARNYYLPGQPGSTGGAEIQMVMLARLLVDAGLRVCHLVFEAPGLPTSISGVTLIGLPEPDDHTRLPERIRDVAGAMRRADATVYVQRSAGFTTGVVGALARAHGRRFVFSSSSVVDFSMELLAPREKLFFRLGLLCAGQIVAQTEDQRVLARTSLNRDIRVIRSVAHTTERNSNEREAFLWVGGLIDYKDPLAYLTLAERLPEARFWMIGTSRGRRWEELTAEVRRRATRLDNVEMLEPRGRERLLELYERCVAVVNTSRFEGFPNTFLEGWSRGAPALSLNVDPDGLISRRSLGAVAHGSLDRLVEAAAELWGNRRNTSQELTVRRYVAEAHAPEVVGPQWAELVRRLAAQMEHRHPDC